MTTRADLRRWVDDWKAVEAVERDEAAREKISASKAVAEALELLNFAARLHGWPLPVDEIDRRDVELARERWVALKTRLGGG